jgi:hypothetical protein
MSLPFADEEIEVVRAVVLGQERWIVGVLGLQRN